MAESVCTSPRNGKDQLKESINRLKYGSPKFREAFRERYVRRLKDRRNKSFSKLRNAIAASAEDLYPELCSDYEELVTIGAIKGRPAGTIDDSLYWDIEQEWEDAANDEEAQFQEEEAKKLDKFVEECLKDIVICPLCLKGCVLEKPDALTCSSCDFRMPLKASLEQFESALNEKIESHSSACDGLPGFVLFPENHTAYLFMTCETCSVMNLVI